MKATKTALFEAARRWETAAVRTIATTLPSLVAATDPKGRTALHRPRCRGRACSTAAW
jgi:hypothetical protein